MKIGSPQGSHWWIGAFAALAGGGIGLFIRGLTDTVDYDSFPYFAATAAFICAVGCWWWLLSRRGTYTWQRGLAAGGLAGGLAHYLCWYLIIVGFNVCFFGWGGCTGSLGDPPVDLLNGLWVSAGLSILSLLAFGWLTVPLGALAGAAAAAWYRRRLRKPPPPVQP
ncbi:MAG: hypothetical protein IT297_04520 [Anaerolineae bacterium]|jgi:hypothetical protein|nr:hypothetical protein [Anaerolineae bacterium]MCZ7553583.1 hypothetical protein [Anaerolineales bacterium]